ncbi:hypothetical protein SXCC_04409 [Gluconacetobacter sp. SXCC-1]|nr:hypothetical protein SXCC_04409 [Gluconacetobacter sp. SXCC-1]
MRNSSTASWSTRPDPGTASCPQGGAPLKDRTFLDAAFFQKGGVLLKFFEKSFTRNFRSFLKYTYPGA